MVNWFELGLVLDGLDFDFFLWGELSAMVKQKSVESAMDLVSRLIYAGATIKETLGTFEHVR